MGQKFIIFILLSFFLVAGCATAPFEQDKEAQYHYKMGLSYLNEGNIKLSFVEFQKAYQLAPNDKDVINSLGFVYMQLEEFEKARELFLRAISIDPQFSEAHNHLGVVYSKTGRMQDAIDSFKKALSNLLYRTPEIAFYNLGMTYYRAGQYEQASNAFKDAIKRSPFSALPYFGLALVYNKEGRYGDAAAIMERALEIDLVYKGDKKRFSEDLKKRLPAAKSEEEADIKDYLEIIRY